MVSKLLSSNLHDETRYQTGVHEWIVGKKVTEKSNRKKSNGKKVTGPIIHEVQASNNLHQRGSRFSMLHQTHVIHGRCEC